MELKYIIEKLEVFAPKELSEGWDNVGLMVGNECAEIKNAVVVLDLTEKAVDFAISQKCELIVTHHPFIMPKLSSINLKTKKGTLIEKLIKNDINVYSMHTNFDSTLGGVNDALSEVLGLKNTYSDGMLRKGELFTPLSLKEFIEKIKKDLNVKHVSYCGDENREIKKIALCGGSGGSFLENTTDCDVFLTGEAKYHEFQYGIENNLPIVTAGHFETENVSLYKIRELLTEIGITVKDGNIHESFVKIS